MYDGMCYGCSGGNFNCRCDSIDWEKRAKEIETAYKAKNQMSDRKWKWVEKLIREIPESKNLDKTVNRIINYMKKNFELKSK